MSRIIISNSIRFYAAALLSAVLVAGILSLSELCGLLTIPFVRSEIAPRLILDASIIVGVFAAIVLLKSLFAAGIRSALIVGILGTSLAAIIGALLLAIWKYIEGPINEESYGMHSVWMALGQYIAVALAFVIFNAWLFLVGSLVAAIIGVIVERSGGQTKSGDAEVSAPH